MYNTEFYRPGIDLEMHGLRGNRMILLLMDENDAIGSHKSIKKQLWDRKKVML